jgi:hypothetical protein
MRGASGLLRGHRRAAVERSYILGGRFLAAFALRAGLVFAPELSFLQATEIAGASQMHRAAPKS